MHPWNSPRWSLPSRRRRIGWPLLATLLVALGGCQAFDCLRVPPVEVLGNRNREPIVPDPAATAPSMDLPEAMAVAERANPTIALAEEAVRERLYAWDYAKTLWLPSLDAGASFNHHQGPLINAFGEVLHVERNIFYGGFGAFAVGGGTVNVPGLRLAAHLGDAVLEPAIARDLFAVQQFQAISTRHTILLNVGVRYVE